MKIGWMAKLFLLLPLLGMPRSMAFASPPVPAGVPNLVPIGIHKKLATGDSVYLAEGAVVMGSFSIENAANVRIFGRGIIANSDQPHQEDFKVIRGAHTKNVTIEGITICNSPGWIISFWNGSDDLTVRNVKMLGNWMYNTDGVQTGTRGLLVEDCLMECNDDNFSLNGDCRNVEIRNSLLWNICNGGVFMLGWGCQWLEKFNIHDCVIFRAGGSRNKGPFAMILTRSGAVVKNIRFRNIIIEDIAQAGYWIDFKLSAPSAVRDIRFDNIEIIKTWRAVAAFNNNSAATPIENIRFNNIRIAGKLMETPDQGGLKLINTGPMTIQGKVFGSLNTVIP